MWLWYSLVQCPKSGTASSAGLYRQHRLSLYRHADSLQPACYHMAVAPALVTLGENVIEVRGHWVWLALSLRQGAELSTTCGWHRVHSRVWLGATCVLHAPHGRLRDTSIVSRGFGHRRRANDNLRTRPLGILASGIRFRVEP